MVMKSKRDDSFVEDIEDTLRPLRRTSMKLNLKKCVFESQKEKFLGDVVTTSGVEANPEKVEALFRQDYRYVFYILVFNL